MYEELLYESILPYLRERFESVAWQVPAFDGRIDLVAISKNCKLHGIELKPTNWLKALKQAQEYAQCVDYVYIAMLESSLKAPLKKQELFNSAGIGLISIGKEVRLIIPPRNSPIKSKMLRKEMLRYIRSKQRKARKLARSRRTKATIKTHEILSQQHTVRAIPEELQRIRSEGVG